MYVINRYTSVTNEVPGIGQWFFYFLPTFFT